MSKIANTITNQYNEIQQLKIDSVQRKNGDFAFVDKLKELIVNQYFKEQDNLWEFFETASDGFVQVMYEGIANMMENVGDIDLCTLSDLSNIAKLLGVDDLSIFSIPWTDELEPLIDTYSVNKEFVLYGRHSTTDLNTIFGTNASGEDINTGYMSQLVDVSFKEVLINMLYDPTSENGIEHIALLEQIVPEEYRGADYTYIAGVRDGTVDRLSDSAHYNMLNDGEMLDAGAKFCRNYCIKILLLRENLKSITQKNAILGTQKIIEKMLTEYVIREFSNVEDLGFYVPTKTESEVLAIGVNNDPFRSWSKFLNNIGDLGSLLNIEVVEYYDTTEYLNIAPTSIPFKTQLVPIYESYSEPYLTVSGQIAYKDPVNRITGYNEVETSEPAKGEGNTRYWEADLSEEDSDSILALFRRLEIIDETDDLDVLMQFLDRVYDIHSPNDWTEFGATDFTSAADLAGMQKKYSGTTGELATSPWTNDKAQDYPTIAPVPFMWNLVEKVYQVFPRLIQYTIETSKQLSTQYENIVDIDASSGSKYHENGTDIKGMIMDSWRSYANEYMSYRSYHEAEDNEDSTSTENKNVQIDGSFNMLALGDLLDIYDTVATGSLFQSFNALTGYYEYVTE